MSAEGSVLWETETESLQYHDGIPFRFGAYSRFLLLWNVCDKLRVSQCDLFARVIGCGVSHL